jgi:hypothetical protein
MSDLETKYKDDGFDKTQVLQYCNDHMIPDPEVAFKTMMYDVNVTNVRTKTQRDQEELDRKIKEESEKAISEYIKNKVVDKTNFTAPVGSGGGATGVGIVEKPKTFEQARKAALSRFS